MKKTISTQELKMQIGEVVDSVRLRGDHYIIERRGQPVAAVVPLQVQENYEKRRKEFFDLMESVAQRNAHIPDDVAEAAIEQAIRDVREEKRRQRQRKQA